ncbi:hypothetical protein HDU86_002550 [Geranomyces michiganensis]|nr:hypothetical protein HDU86_002550 [Geranomyces michiganensis]
MGPTSPVTRFAAQLKTLRAQHPGSLTVFSGDAFAPSVEATVLRGWHMVPILNALGVDVAAFGNHDFDFGEPAAKALVEACMFPWLMSNVEGEGGRAVGGAAQTWTVDRNGLRVGFFALAGIDWPSNCQNLPPDMRFLDPAVAAARMVAQLRGPGGADVVVAITHMRLPADQLVLAACPGIDLVLGGHDHGPVITSDPAAASPCPIVKSGMDFQQLSLVRVRVDRDMVPAVQIIIESHTGFDNSCRPEDPDVKTVVHDVVSLVSRLIDCDLMRSDVDLEGRSTVGRTVETNLGNLLADTLRAYYQCDIALVNSGSIRCNRILPRGVLTVRDIFGIVSGLAFTVDLSRTAGHRVLSVYVGDAPLDPVRLYHVAMSSFIADGYDGYDVFADAETVVGVESGVSETDILMKVFSLQGDKSSGEHEYLAKAREAVVVGTEGGLPVVQPTVEGRIVFV